MTTKQILIDALALMQGGKGWTKKDYAKTETGEHCAISDPLAARFCPLGAMIHESTRYDYDDLEYPYAQSYLEQAVGTAIGTWNDRPETTWNDVETAFQRAIAAS